MRRMLCMPLDTRHRYPYHLYHLIVFSLCLFFGMAYQAHAGMVYCTNPGGYIQVGMTMEAVKEKCGEPFDTQKTRAYVSRKVRVQQYFYQITQNAGTKLKMSFDNGGAGNSTSMVVTVRAHKVTAISVGGTNTQGASLCGKNSFAVGDSVKTMLSACGKAQYVNQSFVEVNDPNSKPAEIETWVIQQNQSYGKSLTLTFQNGILNQIQ